MAEKKLLTLGVLAAAGAPLCTTCAPATGGAADADEPLLGAPLAAGFFLGTTERLRIGGTVDEEGGTVGEDETRPAEPDPELEGAAVDGATATAPPKDRRVCFIPLLS